MTEVDLNYVFKDNEHKRIDSEYFKKEFINFLLKTPKLKPLGAFVHQGYRVVYENTQIIDKGTSLKKDFPIFLQATDLQTPFIKKDNLFHVDEAEWIRYPMGRIKRGELLIEVKGKIEKVSIVPDDFPEKVLVSGSLYKMTVKNINKYYLLTYLISSYGISFKDRNKTNLLISFLSKDDLYRIPVPVLNDGFQNIIEELVRLSYKKIEESQTLYAQAEALLLEELGLKDWQPSEANTAEASFADSFMRSGRLDAEYYQSEYEDYQNKIENYPNGSKPIAVACFINDQNFNPKTGVEYKYIELADIGTIGEVTDFTVGFGEDLPTRARKLVKKGDIIISSIEGSLQKIAIIDKNLHNALCSTGFYVLTPILINTETLLVLFKSKPMQKLLKQACSGTILTSINNSDLERIPLPIISTEIQDEVKRLIEQSQTAQAESKRLLALAKEAVEVAIEQNEAAAEKLIAAQLAKHA